MKQARSSAAALALWAGVLGASLALAELPAEQEAEELVLGRTTSLGTVNKQLIVGGLTRSYWLHLPAGHDGRTPLPLVLMLHGRGWSGPRVELATGMSAKSDAAKFIVVYPTGLGNPRTWNAGRLTGEPHETDMDVAFLRELIAELQRTVPVDPKRIYAAGHGSGGMMAYWLGSVLAEQIAAVGVVGASAGVQMREGPPEMLPKPVRPLPVVILHGQHDRTVRYAGGMTLNSRRNFIPTPDTVRWWATQNGCTNEGKEEAVVGKKIMGADSMASADRGWDPLESTCRHASLSIL